MDPENIRAAFHLPSLASYRNRAHMVGRLAERLDELHLLTFDADRPPSGLRSSAEIVEIPDTPGPGGDQIRASKRAADLVRDRDLDVVHDTFGNLVPLLMVSGRFPSTSFLTSQYILAEWEFRRYFWPKYGLTGLLHPDVRQWIPRVLIHRAALSAADHVVLQAPGLVERITDFLDLPPGKISWIPNSVREVNPPDEDRSSRLEEPLDVLYVAGFAESKGAHHLLDLLELARQRGLDVRARVFGNTATVDGDNLLERVEVEDLEDRVTFHGRVPPEEVEAAYHEADWLFHASREDGSPRAVLEALAHGLPVMGSSHPGIQVLDPGRDFITFVDEDPPRESLQEMQNCLKNHERYHRRVREGLDQVQAVHTSETVAERHAELYARCVVGPEPGPASALTGFPESQD